MTKIEKYDYDICRLTNFLYQRKSLNYHGYYDVEVEAYAMELITDLVKREVERLTAERNNLIRLGGIR